ncbi:hypothetical protein pdul_cds_993 [Pandoravirus dulcis]|uniref:Uncharacterized protein n=1 Tax=Pandoravirus dulcis TaxID=1349409 RepID=S4VS76_9VIRU|nr:hypothetical protein pdul_cds_993 [Pandoravirus dulcis]AGO83253.2 hypothetical protein pdul_cds_993 [Pandoravirus dulcis]
MRKNLLCRRRWPIVFPFFLFVFPACLRFWSCCRRRRSMPGAVERHTKGNPARTRPRPSSSLFLIPRRLISLSIVACFSDAMFWRRARAKTSKAAGAAPAVAAPGTYQEPTRPSYDDVEYWERERLDPWAAARAEAQAWSKRYADVAAARARATAASTAGAQGAGACIVEPAGASYAAGFTTDTGLVTPAAFDARVPREARLVLAVGDARVPVAFDAREVVNAVGHGGLFRSEAVVDPYGVWGLVAARDTLGPDRHGVPTRGPGLAAVALGPRPAAAGARPGGLGAPLQYPPAFSMYDDVAVRDAGYNDMYGDDDDDGGGDRGGQDDGDPRL